MEMTYELTRRKKRARELKSLRPGLNTAGSIWTPIEIQAEWELHKDTMGGKEVRSATVEHKVREESGRDGQNGYDTRKLERSATTGTRDIVERA